MANLEAQFGLLHHRQPEEAVLFLIEQARSYRADHAKIADALKKSGLDRMDLSFVAPPSLTDRSFLESLDLKDGFIPPHLLLPIVALFDTAVGRLKKNGAAARKVLFDPRAVALAAPLAKPVLERFFQRIDDQVALAKRSETYRDHLVAIGNRINWVALAPPTNGSDGCEYCIIQVTDDHGNFLYNGCGSQDDCEALGTILDLLLLIALAILIYDVLDDIF